MPRGERVTIYLESFLNEDVEMQNAAGEKVECDWDVSWATEDGKALYWAGMPRGYRILKRGKLVFVAGQKEAQS